MRFRYIFSCFCAYSGGFDISCNTVMSSAEDSKAEIQPNKSLQLYPASQINEKPYPRQVYKQKCKISEQNWKLWRKLPLVCNLCRDAYKAVSVNKPTEKQNNPLRNRIVPSLLAHLCSAFSTPRLCCNFLKKLSLVSALTIVKIWLLVKFTLLFWSCFFPYRYTGGGATNTDII